MTDQAPFILKGRNPDVLSCIANLSNDEVFTPPEFANRRAGVREMRFASSAERGSASRELRRAQSRLLALSVAESAQHFRRRRSSGWGR